jgi:polysaccharide biosynthesis/export protein
MKRYQRNIGIGGMAFLLLQMKVDVGAHPSRAIQDRSAATPIADTPQIGSPSPGPGPSEELPIGPGDLIEISLFGSPDFNQTVRVNNTNTIVLPLIGEVDVVGLSPEEAATLIRKKLVDGNFYTNPQVSVFVKEYAMEGVYVLGEVQKPGFYSILSARDVMQAISLAGGTTPKAGKVVTIKNPRRPKPVTISLASMEAGKTDAIGETDVKLMPADVINVSKAGIVYVIGDVHLPTGIVLENENLTVLQAIALAQGTNPTAALNDARLIHAGLDGPKEENIPLKKILDAKAPDIKVQANDIIFVPVSTAKAVSRRGIDSILQAVTGIAMYAHY